MERSEPLDGPDPVLPVVGHVEHPLRQVFEAHWDGLTYLAQAIVGDRHAAQEVVAEAFARTLEGWDRVRDQERPYWYVRTAVVRLAQRRVWRWRNRVLLLPTLPDRAAAASPAAGSLDDDVVSALEGLPRQQRACVVLHYVEDLSVAECAEVLSIAEGTVKAHLSRARDHLRRRLEPPNDHATG